MKTLGRILIILVVFSLVMGTTYVAVNASGTFTNGAPRFENGGRPFAADGQFQLGQRPPDGSFEGRREGGERGFGVMGLMFGFVKNIIIIAVVVALIALPRNWMRNRKRTVPVAAE